MGRLETKVLFFERMRVKVVNKQIYTFTDPYKNITRIVPFLRPEKMHRVIYYHLLFSKRIVYHTLLISTNEITLTIKRRNDYRDSYP